jgi:hypothetical protein
LEIPKFFFQLTASNDFRYSPKPSSAAASSAVDGAKMSPTDLFKKEMHLTGVTIRLPLPAETPKAFASLPEWIIDDMADFILFAMQ